MQREWRDAVREAVRRVSDRNGSNFFTRQELITTELDQIFQETASEGCTPDQTLSRVLQDLRDLGEIEFLGRGKYRKLQ